MLIRDPPECRAGYWKLIENIIAQIVLNRKGIDPDFTESYKLDVDLLCKNFTKLEKFDFIEKNYKIISSQMAQVLKEKQQMEVEIRGI